MIGVEDCCLEGKTTAPDCDNYDGQNFFHSKHFLKFTIQFIYSQANFTGIQIWKRRKTFKFDLKNKNKNCLKITKIVNNIFIKNYIHNLLAKMISQFTLLIILFPFLDEFLIDYHDDDKFKNNRQMSHDHKKQQIRECFFQLQVAQGTGSIKFPCSFFIEWKTSNNKNSVTSNNRIKLISGKLNYNEKFQLITNMIFDCRTQTYHKKQSIVMVNLVSNSRPNEPKLVGRVVADLGAVANRTHFQQMKSYALEYCSVEATLSFKIVFKTFLPTTLSVKDLQRSQLSEFQPIAFEKHSQRDIKQSRDDTRSQKGEKHSVISSLRKERSHVKLGQSMTLEERINRIKSQKADKQLAKSGKNLQQVSSRLKRQKQQQIVSTQIKNNHRQQIQKVQKKYQQQNQIETNHRVASQIRKSRIMQQANEFIVPILPRDIHQFDSAKASQKSIPNSQKQHKNIIPINIRSEIQQNETSPSSIKKIITSLKSSQQEQLSFNKDESQTHIRTQLQILKQQNRAIIEENKTKMQQLEQKYHKQIGNLNSKLEELSKIILKQNQDSNSFKQNNYHNQIIEQLRSQINDKDKQIDQYEQIIHKFEDSQSYVQEIIDVKEQNKELMEQNQLVKSNLEEKLKIIFDLENKIKKMQTHNQSNNQFSNHISHQSIDQINRINSQLEQTQQRLQTEMKNHQNTKLQLSQLRDWYNDLQEQTNKLQTEYSNIQSQLQTQNDYKTKLEQIQQKNKSQVEKLIQQKDIQMDTMMQTMNNQINQLKEEIIAIQDQTKIANQITGYEREKEEKLSKEFAQTQKELDQLQLRYLEIDQQLKLQKEKVIELQNLLNDSDKKHIEKTTILQKKQEQAENHQRKVNDILRRLKDKQETILKMHRDVEQSQSKAKQLQFASDQYKDKLKLVEREKNIQLDKSKQLQKQNKLLKNKLQKQNENHIKELSKLKQKIDDDAIRKKQLSNLLNEIQLKSNNTGNKKINQLQQTIVKYQQKQKSLRQNLNLLEFQTNRISDLIVEKETNQEILNQQLIYIKQQNNELQIRVNQLENQCQLFIERNQGLTAEIQLLNTYNGGETDTSEIAQFNRKLMEKNKELLDQVEIKNQQIAQMSKNEGQLKGLTVSQQLSNSRYQKQKNQLEERIVSLTEQNQKLYTQFDKLNQKYQQELNNRKNQQQLIELQNQVQQLHSKITEKQLKNQQMQIQQKQELQKIHEALSEKDFQLEYYINQINQLNRNIQNLNSQVEQKQLQINELTEKTKQFNYKVAELQNTIKEKEVNNLNENRQQSNDLIVVDHDHLQVIQQYKLKIDYLQAENQRILEKIQLSDKQLQTLTSQIVKIKQKSQEQLKYISYLESQLKSYREREAAYMKQIDDLETVQKQFKNRSNQLDAKEYQIKVLQQQLTHSESNRQVLQDNIFKSQQQLMKVKKQIERHIEQIARLKQNLNKSKEYTPIHRFSQSPESSKQQMDMNDVLVQISDLLIRRKQEQQLQNALRLVIDNNTKQAQEFDKWNRDRGVIQQKAKLASKQLQKVKATIMKSNSKTIFQKTQLTNMLKPTELIVNQMIRLSELLAEMDIDLQQQQQFEEENNENHTN